ncbi:MAG: cytidine deaminase [Lachnospiraceae bacterium]|nr:cytidine deaminase [Lachnospiraceae bacterium]
MVSETQKKELVKKALENRLKAYTPYSHHKVGAALLGKNGVVYDGCNIENAAYTPSNCAERTAFFKAVSEGQYEFEAIAIVGGMDDAKELDYCPPCGVCRQVMREFCRSDFEIYLAKDEDNIKTYKLVELLPEGFGPEFLED